ncbi:TraR/DksA family transcriptional regulator [Helicobacter muridarum]|uniref:DnaK suppressor protein DskA n=1 Tax=Helicobacter muridarum TaxID=216 RepID=A0A099TXA3_9HELI|nr:TraR/DksA C4-type zinc finger protein [Helicobacter muridarum]TLE00066.1 TraR/DksA family transcriptional regulator [Helicobacter muridarum]STQ86086.1 DnaK suppressor protein DskA [Helicobacter muridarum]
MRDEDILELKYMLENRLKYLDSVSIALEKNLKEMASLKLNENTDIISIQSQLRFDDSMLERHQREINEIIYSLSKFEANEYGICEMCEDEIGIERLYAKPHAKYCISCREVYEKKEKQKEKS